MTKNETDFRVQQFYERHLPFVVVTIVVGEVGGNSSQCETKSGWQDFIRNFVGQSVGQSSWLWLLSRLLWDK